MIVFIYGIATKKDKALSASFVFAILASIILTCIGLFAIGTYSDGTVIPMGYIGLIIIAALVFIRWKIGKSEPAAMKEEPVITESKEEPEVEKEIEKAPVVEEPEEEIEEETDDDDEYITIDLKKLGKDTITTEDILDALGAAKDDDEEEDEDEDEEAYERAVKHYDVLEDTLRKACKQYAANGGTCLDWYDHEFMGYRLPYALKDLLEIVERAPIHKEMRRLEDKAEKSPAFVTQELIRLLSRDLNKNLMPESAGHTYSIQINDVTDIPNTDVDAYLNIINGLECDYDQGGEVHILYIADRIFMVSRIYC